MNRPAVIRHIDRHVAGRAVTAYRLRTTDAERLLRYIEHLEARPTAEGIKAAMVAQGIPEASQEGRDIADVLDGATSRFVPCGACGLVGGHMVDCPEVARV